MAEYLIHVRPDPTCRVPGIIGLRRLLKALLRSYGLVAVDVRECDSTTSPTACGSGEAPACVASGMGAAEPYVALRPKHVRASRRNSEIPAKASSAGYLPAQEVRNG